MTGGMTEGGLEGAAARRGNAAAPLAVARRRVGLGDVDGARLIYFAVPFRWSEELMSSWLVDLGHPLGEMFESGSALPVVATRCEFHAPLRQDQEIELRLDSVHVGVTSLALRTRVFSVGRQEASCVVQTSHVYAEQSEGAVRPRPLPAWLRAGLGVPALDE